MKTFNDKTGRAWSLVINVDAIKRVRGLLDIDLIEAVEGKLLERLASDPILLCDVVYAVCKPDADAKKISDEDFGRAMAGDAIDAATTALLEELVDFFPSARRGLLTKSLKKIKTLEAIALKRADEVLESDKFERAIEAELDKVEAELETSLQNDVGDSSSNSPDSPASTPDR